MGAYKKLNKQDAYITTRIAHKTWIITGSEFASYGITTATATGSYLNSLQHLYYPVEKDGNVVSHSFDYYDQSSLYLSSSRNLTTGSFILSIPRSLYGVNLQPDIATKLFFTGLEKSLYAKYKYWEDEYVNEPAAARVYSTVDIDDDGEGNIYIMGTSPRYQIGNIIYPHGMIIITDPYYSKAFSKDALSSIQFGSSQPIYTHNYHCRVRESEFNFTYNPSALSSSLETVYSNLGYAEGYYDYNINDYDLQPVVRNASNGVIKNNLTGSSFQPYITTVGLYNEANQLIAVGKMSQPIPKSANTEMTIIVKIDI